LNQIKIILNNIKFPLKSNFEIPLNNCIFKKTKVLNTKISVSVLIILKNKIYIINEVINIRIIILIFILLEV